MKTQDRSTDRANSLDGHQLASRRLAKLIDCERVISELHGRVDALQQDHFQGLRTANAFARQIVDLEQQIIELQQALEIRDTELAALRPVARSWWGSGWRAQHWASDSANWVAVGKRLLARVASVRLLRRLIGIVLRVTPSLRARLLAMIDST
jgi:hypothetical protein